MVFSEVRVAQRAHVQSAGMIAEENMRKPIVEHSETSKSDFPSGGEEA